MIRIGIDIGGVLIGKGRENNSLFDVPNSLETLQTLSEKYRLYIISYSKEGMAQSNYNNLINYNLFWSQYYVDNKSYKASIVKHLSCNVMIDDNENILNQVKNENPEVTTILFQRYNKQKKKSHRKHILVDNWVDIITVLERLDTNNNIAEKDEQGVGYFIYS